jgi:catalase (peroxidase I)
LLYDATVKKQDEEVRKKRAEDLKEKQKNNAKNSKIKKILSDKTLVNDLVNELKQNGLIDQIDYKDIVRSRQELREKSDENYNDEFGNYPPR